MITWIKEFIDENIWALPFILLWALVVFADKSEKIAAAKNERIAAERLNSLVSNCRQGDRRSCYVLEQLVKEDPVDRCLYGDGDYGACHDAADEYEDYREEHRDGEE